ncbi:hypothetical protein [Marinifilum sp. D737]|uniref:hypothetical protein n=1 Tax=Marinifilum sp. D737 TaxID=2969628 RepID=UPI002273BCB4|nr:hypothetical protein [Marinifilum sp. D737]MCY1635847.1 hypothetical protein [Marinifilum sp. D737]
MKKLNDFTQDAIMKVEMSELKGGEQVGDKRTGQNDKGYYMYWYDDEEGYVGAYMRQFA